jgi:anti-sigma B factor antagonist
LAKRVAGALGVSGCGDLPAPTPEARAPAHKPFEFGVRQRRVGDICMVRVSGDLDLSAHEPLDEALRRAEASDAQRIWLDLSGATFIDLAGARALMAATEPFRADRNRLRLFRVHGQVRRLLETTGLLDQFEFTAD